MHINKLLGMISGHSPHRMDATDVNDSESVERMILFDYLFPSHK